MATVLYVTPHPDDETLSMGASIRLHLEAGHDVHVLQLTYGINSAVRASTGLSRSQFVAARDDELVRATRDLGVPPRNVHIARMDTADGLLTVLAAEDMLGSWLADHPGVWVKSYSHLPAAGRHQDHITAGQAAVNLAGSGVITNLRLYVEPWARSAFLAANPGVTLGAERAAAQDRVRAACDQYQDIDLVGRKYGIGYRSVPTYFDLVRPDPVSYYHTP